MIGPVVDGTLNPTRFRVRSTAAMPSAATTVIAAAARAAVSIGRAPDIMAAYLAMLDAMPPALVPQLQRIVATEIATAKWRLDQTRTPMMTRLAARLWPRPGVTPPASPAQIAEGPAVWLHLFDGNGYAREAALRRMSVPATPARLAGLVLRLYDWVPEVRQAALEALERHGPALPAECIVECMPFIAEAIDVRQFADWLFMPELDIREETALGQLIGQDRLHATLVERFLKETDTNSFRIFRYVLRTDRIDPELPKLAREARHPAIRALALRSVLTGIVEGYPTVIQEIVSERLGAIRTRKVRGRRDCHIAADVATLIRSGASDRTLLVRKAAADGLIRHWRDVDDLDGLIAAFGTHPGKSVGERLDFIRRKRAEG